jgi:uncharacterized membrane protein (UPF0127 family)
MALGALGCKSAARGTPDAAAPSSAPVVEVQDPAAQNYKGPPLPIGHVVLRDAYGNAHRVEVEVAADGISRQRGLMWRASLVEGKGMLFIFPGGDQEHSFWMRNTLIPLDMVFINAEKQVVGVVVNAEPQSLVSRTVGKPSTYVLEVPGGWCDAKGIQAGAKVELEGISMIPVTP